MKPISLQRSVLLDVLSFAPVVGNVIRVMSWEDVGIDFTESKTVDDVLYTMGTVFSFIPVATIIYAKNKIRT